MALRLNPSTGRLDLVDVNDVYVGSGGYAANLYFTTIDSDVTGYKKFEYTAEASETELSIPCTTTEILARTYLFDGALATSVIDAGKWAASFRAKVNKTQGATLKFEAFLYHTDTTETTLFTASSDKIINTTYETLSKESTQPIFTCDPTDRLGCRVYASTTLPAGVTLNTIVGDGNASYFSTPLSLRHSQLRDKNGETDYQHIPTSEVAKIGGVDTVVDTVSELPETATEGDLAFVNELEVKQPYPTPTFLSGSSNKYTNLFFNPEPVVPTLKSNFEIKNNAGTTIYTLAGLTLVDDGYNLVSMFLPAVGNLQTFYVYSFTELDIEGQVYDIGWNKQIYNSDTEESVITQITASELPSYTGLWYIDDVSVLELGEAGKYFKTTDYYGLNSNGGLYTYIDSEWVLNAPDNGQFLRLDQITPQSVIRGTPSFSDIKIPSMSLGTPTYSTQNDFNNSFGSVGVKSGGIMTDATGGYIAVSGGTGFIKATDDDNAQLMFFDFPAPTNIQIPASSTRYIGVEYNDGTPQVVARTTWNWNLDTEFPLGRVINESINGTASLHIINSPWWVTDGITNIIERFRGFGRILRDENVGGLAISVTGTRNIAVTTGTLWSNVNEFVIPAIDTSVTGTIEGYWYKAGSGWQDSDLTQYSVTEWNDITKTTLQTISLNKYCNIWIYAEADDLELALIYPQNQYNTAAAAEAMAAPANLPQHIAQNGILIGRIIIKQGVDAPVAVQTAWGTTFTASVATDHGNLTGLGDDDHQQYMRLDQTSVQTIINNIPLLESSRTINADNQLVDKKYVDDNDIAKITTLDKTANYANYAIVDSGWKYTFNRTNNIITSITKEAV